MTLVHNKLIKGTLRYVHSCILSSSGKAGCHYLYRSSRTVSQGMMLPVKGVLIDITGVLYESGTEKAINGSVEAIDKIQAAKFPYKFVTNETQRTVSSLASMLQKFGFRITESDIFAPAPAVKAMLLEANLRPHFLVHPRTLPEFDGCDTSNPNCVVVGDAAEYFSYENVNHAFQLLMNMEKPRIISMGKGRYYREGEQLQLDLGAYVTGLEYACGITAEVIGKPEQHFFHHALKSIGISPNEAAMIGDDVNSDIGGAQACGMCGILVRTGKYRPSDECHPKVKPYAVVKNLSEAVDRILKSC